MGTIDWLEKGLGPIVARIQNLDLQTPGAPAQGYKSDQAVGVALAAQRLFACGEWRGERATYNKKCAAAIESAAALR